MLARSYIGCYRDVTFKYILLAFGAHSRIFLQEALANVPLSPATTAIESEVDVETGLLLKNGSSG